MFAACLYNEFRLFGSRSCYQSDTGVGTCIYRDERFKNPLPSAFLSSWKRFTSHRHLLLPSACPCTTKSEYNPEVFDKPRLLHDALPAVLLRDQAVCMTCSGAVLGPFCDGLHSQSDVLHYANPSIIIRMGAWELETCW